MRLQFPFAAERETNKINISKHGGFRERIPPCYFVKKKIKAHAENFHLCELLLLFKFFGVSKCFVNVGQEVFFTDSLKEA